MDYCKLNTMTVSGAYPLPNIAENLDKLQCSTIFSSLDAARAYHIIPVEESSHPLLAFPSPFGTYQYKRMPFGAKNAGGTFLRFMQLMVNKLRSP